MSLFWRGAVVGIALGVVVSSSQAYILIDDFTVGDYHRVLMGSQSDSHQLSGLDQAHCLFGRRGWAVDIFSNPEGGTLAFDIGNGEQKLQSTSRNLNYDVDLLLGVSGNVLVDFSQESEIWVDYYTDNNSFADSWSLVVTDKNGFSAGDGNFLTRGTTGLRFRKQDFGVGLDWSNIRSIEFHQRNDQPTNPLLYSVTSVYAVPESSPFVIVTFCVCGLFVRRHRKHSN